MTAASETATVDVGLVARRLRRIEREHQSSREPVRLYVTPDMRIVSELLPTPRRRPANRFMRWLSTSLWLVVISAGTMASGWRLEDLAVLRQALGL